MPVPIPGSELHQSPSRTTYNQRHLRLSDDNEDYNEDILPSRSYLPRNDGGLEEKALGGGDEVDEHSPKHGSALYHNDLNQDDKDEFSSSHPKVAYASKASTSARNYLSRGKPGSFRFYLQKTMDVLIRNGVEERGIEPVPEGDRVELLWWTVIPQWTLWAAANTNILTVCIESYPSIASFLILTIFFSMLIPQTHSLFPLLLPRLFPMVSQFSAGTLGPALFGLDLNSSVWTILVFGFLSSLPVAFFATFGPILGMRQMVQARFSFG